MSNNQARQLLGRLGGRVTPARSQVLQLLLDADRALTHTELEQAVQAAGVIMDRVTLYRVLDYLVTHGLAHKMAGTDRLWRFNASPSIDHHHAHFQCAGCGRLFCLDAMPAVPAPALPGYRVERAEITFFGQCPDCLKSS